VEWNVDQIDVRVAVIRADAGERLDRLEINALVQQVEITDDRRAVIEAAAQRVGGVSRTS
jgi:hypothetical protein